MARRGAQLPPGWVRPHRLEAGPATTAAPSALGTVDGGVAATVDERGLLAPAAGGWALDWWVGAEDGWHVPGRAPASRVRQSLVRGTPVVETTMRVPGGEIVHRCYATRADAATDAVVVEVENGSHVPVALALAVRPYDHTSVATLRRVALRDDVVTVDGRPAIQLGRAPAFAAAAGGGADVAEEVFAGTRGAPVDVGEIRDRQGLATLAVVFPLPHTASLRVTIAPGDVVPASLPDGDAVARGWEAHIGRAMRVVVPDEPLQEGISACLCRLLLTADALAFDDALVVAAMERWGMAADVARLADQRGYRVRAGAGFLVDDEGVAGDADDVLDALDALVASASSTWTWPADGHPAQGPARLLALVRRILVGDDPQGEGTLAVWPLVSERWLGQGVEVHDAPTFHGPLSYAVRWHGARPAVLWEAPPGVRITAPGLDAAWSASGSAGEALLAPVEPAGGLPKVYGGVETPDGVDEPGGSFR